MGRQPDAQTRHLLAQMAIMIVEVISILYQLQQEMCPLGVDTTSDVCQLRLQLEEYVSGCTQNLVQFSTH